MSLSSAFFAALAGAVFVRLFYGVNFLDEAYYVALPYTFALGNRPLVNELFVSQLSGLLLTPPVVGYVALVGSAEGLVLFMRCLFFVYSLGCCAVVIAFLRGRIGLPGAILVAGLVITFVPAAIPSLSYNTLGYLGFTCGSFLIAHGVTSRAGVARVLAGVAFHASAAMAYPALVPAAAIACASGVVLAWRGSERSGRRGLVAGIGAIVCVAVALIALVVLDAGPDAVARARDYAASFQFGRYRGGWAKVLEVLTLPPEAKRFVSTMLVGVVVLWLVTLLGGLPAIIAALAVPIASLWLPREQAGGGQYAYLLVLGLGLLPVVVLPLLWCERRTSRQMVPEMAVWLWSLVAGLCTAWASANGIRNAQLGLLPGAVMAAAWLLRLGSTQAGSGLGRHGRAAVFVALVASCELLQLRALYGYVYLDAPMRSLTAWVPEGPFRGLRTTPKRRDFLRQLRDDLRAVEPGNASIAFLDDFPGGFLFTRLIPQTPTVWVFGNWTAVRIAYDRSVLRRYYADDTMLPDVVVQFRAVPLEGNATLPTRPRPRDELLELFAPPAYAVRIARPNYVILQRVRGTRDAAATRP